MATTAEIAAATTARLATFTTVQLRKVAAAEYGIKGMSSARKADLLAAINAKEVELVKIEELAAEIEKGSTPQEALATVDAKEEEEAEALAAKINGKTAKAKTARKPKRDLDQSDVDADGEMAADANPADVAVRDGKGKVRGTKCQICRTAKIDKKTQGRDSTMCRDCYDYAGWENVHSDDDHEGRQDDPAYDLSDCPVCATLRKEESPADASPKALRFAEDARKAGWAATVTVSGGFSRAVAVCVDGRTIELSWAGAVYAYDLSKFKTASGAKGAKVRNASAARMILDA